MNTIDTQALSECSQGLADSAVAEYMTCHGLKQGRTLGFLGGLDESKRISFLAEALDRLWATDPDLRVVVGGKGSQSNLLDVSISRGQTIRIGYATPYERAIIGRVASALLMPGRIGLVAVDALVLGIPILTTDWPYHSAEADYLIEGESRYTSGNDVDSYVALVRRFMLSPGNGGKSSSGSSWAYPTIDNMVANFSAGVLSMLGKAESPECQS
ncbi:glycosyltransferase [Arthrobacter sp. PsM3]|uniref:glycosyltransferase n=1 Tax=Arthrobacter sp. PsM3 TaxID=3030531 RepID=UPI00263AAD79|nr:glycosyltransferase [Arthrobacter sp. PsM3]MDN4645141.1 glycosyltransferase [Arthrobacter sp. PsM3]